MATTWGPIRSSSRTNGARTGINVWLTGSGSSRTVNWAVYLWTKRASYGQSSPSYRVNATGVNAVSGNFSYNHRNNSRDWPTNNRTKVRSGSFSVSMSYGSSKRITVSASITGIGAVSGTAKHSRAITVPARAYLSPSSPTNVRATRSSDTRHTVRWSRNTSTARPYSRQRLQRRVYNLGWGSWSTRATLSGSATSWQDRGTRDNRVYQWRVRAENSAGSNTSSSTDAFYTTPWQPTNVKAQETRSGIKLSWENRARFNSYEYRIQHQAGDGSYSTIATRSSGTHGSTSSWTHVDPDLSVTHRYAIESRTTDGTLLKSEWIYSNRVELAAPPNAPTGLGPTGSWDATEDHVLRWTHSPTDRSDQERFEIRHRYQGDPGWTTEPVVDSEVSRWTLPAETYLNGDPIEWQVRTWGIHPDVGPWSSTAITEPTARPIATIVTPDDDEIVESSSVAVEIAYEQEQEIPQAGWRFTLSNLTTGEDEQDRAGSSARPEFTLDDLEDDSDYRLTYAVRSGAGLWSIDTSALFSVAYVSPPRPEATATWDVERGAAVIEITNPPEADENTYQNVISNPRGRNTRGTVVMRTNPVAGFISWDTTGGADAISPSHAILTGDRPADASFSMPTSSPVPIQNNATSAQWYFEARSTEGRPSVPDEAALRVASTVGGGAEAVSLATFPADGTWYEVVVPVTSALSGPLGLRFYLGTSTSTEVEIRYVQVGWDDVHPGEFFDGDSDTEGEPDDEIDGITVEWTGTPGESTSTMTAPKPTGWVGAFYDPYSDRLGAIPGEVAMWGLAGLAGVFVVEDEDGTTHTDMDGGDLEISGPSLFRAAYVPYVYAGNTVDEYIGAYFDGDTERGGWTDEGSPARHRWDGEPHKSTSTRITGGAVPAEFNEVWRSFDLEHWTLIAAEVSLDTSILDPIPAIGDDTINYYEVVAHSDLPSTAKSEHAILEVTTHMTEGWVYVNGGENMADMVRVKDNVRLSVDEGIETEFRHYAGRLDPVPYMGTARSISWSLTADLSPNPDGQSTRLEWVEMQATPGAQCYRDPLSARDFCRLMPISNSFERRQSDISLEFIAADFQECLCCIPWSEERGEL